MRNPLDHISSQTLVCFKGFCWIEVSASRYKEKKSRSPGDSDQRFKKTFELIRLHSRRRLKQA